tara:strand:+ start:201 stop:743 length:543 start_codon:yes stop_codon:yes gene_type:complete
MNNLQRYVNYAQPVINAVRENHNEFHHLEYFSVNAEDLFVEEGFLIEFQSQDKYFPEHFNGAIPLVYANWGEETGASIVLEISPEQRQLLSPEVINVIKGEHLEYHEKWRKTAEQTVWLLMDHEYYQTCSGFVPSDEFEDALNVGHAIDFLAHRMGLNYLTIDFPYSRTEYMLESEESNV